MRKFLLVWKESSGQLFARFIDSRTGLPIGPSDVPDRQDTIAIRSRV
jgi:hypothetical protein